MLFAPWLDLTLADPAAREVEPRDLMLRIDNLRMAGASWANGDDLRTPRLSPLYADLQGLPPTHLFQGGDNLFVVDSRTLVGKVEAAGGEICYAEYPCEIHFFMAAVWTPEARDVFHKLGQALRLLG